MKTRPRSAFRPLSRLVVPPLLLIVAMVSGIHACSPPTPTVNGSVGDACQTDYDCLNGETCVSQVCTADGPDAGNGSGGGDAGHGSGGDSYCTVCASDSDCGGGGNLCIAVAGSSRAYCGTACVQGMSTCPAGGRCYSLSSVDSASGYACFPSSGTCAAGTPDAGETQSPDAGPTHPPDAGPMNMGGPAGSSFASCTNFTWADCLSTWFSNTCFSCHQHSGETESWVENGASTIESYISSGIMPQGSTDPNASADAQAIKTWMSDGHP